ncbi:MAG: FAD-dependent oxidoreductase [Leptospiraceae bacterium]|nr:FAD-dependent oxidoreductase [Leptospiraceae bacterium]
MKEINRKEFLKYSSIAILSLGFGKSIYPKNTKEKVAIIGAGAAGLYAGYLLHKRGIDVEIFEASSIIGGRARPLLKFSDFPVELGAEEVHGEKSKYYKYLKRMGIALIDSDFENYYVIDDKLTEESVAELYSKFSKSQRLIQKISSYKGGDGTALDYFRNNGIPNSHIHIPEALVGNEYGTDLKNLSILGVAKNMSGWSAGDENFLIRSRSHLSVLEEICERVLKFTRKKTQITNIDYSGSIIKLTDQDGNEFKATRVIVTVPITILKDGDIKFSPSLPGEISSAFSKIGMGAGIKVILKFIRRFWEPNTGSIVSNGVIPEYWASGYRKSSMNNVLTGFVNGENAKSLSESNSNIVSLALKDLDKMFGNKIATKWLTDSYIMDWSKDPFIRGSYSYPTVGEGDAREELAKPVKERLFFAGEATNTEQHFGTIHGAMDSAIRVVDQIFDIL